MPSGGVGTGARMSPSGLGIPVPSPGGTRLAKVTGMPYGTGTRLPAGTCGLVRLLGVAGIAILLAVGAASAGTMSTLRFFSDGCAVVPGEVQEIQICEQGPRAGAPCEQMPEFGDPKFSLDCCNQQDGSCFTNNPEAQCSDPSPRRTCVSGAIGRLCVTNAGCDTDACLRGNPDLLGQGCQVDSQCGSDPNDPNSTPFCGPAQNGECGPQPDPTSGSRLGQVMQVDDQVALLAIVTGIIETAQPTNNKKDRRMPELAFELVDSDDLVNVNQELCNLATRFGRITPTRGLFEQDPNGDPTGD